MKPALALALLASAAASLPACAREPETPSIDGPTTRTQRVQGPVDTKVTALAVHLENLNVDKISMRDGSITPDGSRDLVFTATVQGPADALYLLTTDAKGNPLHGFRADTIPGHEALPDELAAAGQVDVGRMTVWIAAVENGKFINQESGRLGDLAEGVHQLKLYVPNTGTLRPGHHLRLYARGPGKAIVGGPVIPY